MKAADDDNDNYVLVKETTFIQCDTLLHMKIKVWKTHGIYRKGIKGGYTRFYKISVIKIQLLYHL